MDVNRIFDLDPIPNYALRQGADDTQSMEINSMKDRCLQSLYPSYELDLEVLRSVPDRSTVDLDIVDEIRGRWRTHYRGSSLGTQRSGGVSVVRLIYCIYNCDSIV
jgi:hypothetical protein